MAPLHIFREEEFLISDNRGINCSWARGGVSVGVEVGVESGQFGKFPTQFYLLFKTLFTQTACTFEIFFFSPLFPQFNFLYKILNLSKFVNFQCYLWQFSWPSVINDCVSIIRNKVSSFCLLLETRKKRRW